VLTWRQETFEDAPDTTTARPQSSQSHSSASVRSLTGGRALSATSATTPRVSGSQPRPGNYPNNDMNAPSTAGEGDESKTKVGEPPTQTPLLTARRISTSSLHDVQLADSPGTTSTANAIGTSDKTASSSVKLPTNEVKMDESTPTTAPVSAAPPPSKLPFRSQGLSGSLPSVPWGPPPAPKPLPAQTPSPAPGPPSRKLAGPFSWLSRGSSAKTETQPPKAVNTQTERRSTATSISSVGANPELMLSRLDEGNESDGSNVGSRRQTGNSLRDRFKMLRMREEAGIQVQEGSEADSSPMSGGAIAGLIGRGTSLGLVIGSPTSIADEKEKGPGMSPVQSPSSAVPPPVDPGLAPGTAVGVTAGPSAINDPAAPVDWDLWQSVVYEGPAAVARTSAEELNRAIASGIPSAIRGVVWQVLAQSKNEDLESVYKELVVRGTDKDRGFSKEPPSGNMNGQVKEMPSIASSASSVHSEHSTPATSAANGVASPSSLGEKDNESAAKLQAAMMAERKKRSEDDAAALKKLEKLIRKDLGARTSYSKYAVAAGLQDALFGVCKAYALFDEAVGYAQGMNFLIMPLLFNVGWFCVPHCDPG